MRADTHTRWIGVLAIGALALLLPRPLPAQDRAAPEVAGQSLPLRAKATRDMFFGAVDLYSVGIYAAQPVAAPAALRDAKLSKALRIDVLYDGGMPGTVPSGWWEGVGTGAHGGARTAPAPRKSPHARPSYGRDHPRAPECSRRKERR